MCLVSVLVIVMGNVSYLWVSMPILNFASPLPAITMFSFHHSESETVVQLLALCVLMLCNWRKSDQAFDLQLWNLKYAVHAYTWTMMYFLLFRWKNLKYSVHACTWLFIDIQLYHIWLNRAKTLALIRLDLVQNCG
jgi:hypothetical protein